MTIEDYLQPGDHIVAMPRSTLGKSVDGRIVEVRAGVLGAREFVVVPEGTDFTIDGAVGFNERDYVIRVERGDCWIHMPVISFLEHAQEQVERHIKNQERKAKKDFPLFADQVQIKTSSAQERVDQSILVGRRELEHDHNEAQVTNSLREEVRAKVTPEDYAMLLKRRTIYPGDATYGKMFWSKQLAYIAEHGFPEAPPVLPLDVSKAIGGVPSWLLIDGPAIWSTAPGKPLLVRVLLFGRETIMVQIMGKPIKDYDPVIVDGSNQWLRPEELGEAPDGLYKRDEWINLLPFSQQPYYREKVGLPRAWVLPEDLRGTMWEQVTP